MRKIHDITMTIKNGMLVYPGDPGVSLKRVREIGHGSSANLSEYCMGSHTGTHIDPQFHFLPDGAKADALPLDSLIGPALVLDVPSDEITKEFLENASLENVKRLLFKTQNSRFSQDPAFHEDFAHLMDDAAEYLVKHGIKLVGIDYLSVEKYHSKDHAVHMAFLRAGVVILEGLDLSGVGPGWYELICLPMKVEGGDGAPARAVLVEGD
jgi:arylformamidase